MDKHSALLELIEYLFEERNQGDQAIAVRTQEKRTPLPDDRLWDLFRALVNTREAAPASERFLELQDDLLKTMIAETGIAHVGDADPSPIDPRIRLWRGDITTIAADGIVNAANSQMLGCWVPGHHCIDNAIHTFAGVQLRLACSNLMQAQGHEEPTAEAKVTDAFNLPSKYIIHTVGPIANGNPTAQHRSQLARCYEKCLDAAAEHHMESIAFCCISTGVFGFPQQEAAEIAVHAVRSWLASHGYDPNGSENENGGMTVVFNVFGAADEEIYRNLLGFS